MLKPSLRTLVLIRCGATLLACSNQAGEETPAPTPGGASCEALADHLLDECPEHGSDRLFNIMLCEEDRLRSEPIGCGKQAAAYVQCNSVASVDCESGEVASCEQERSAAMRCKQAFAASTVCSRVAAQDFRCVDRPEASFAFACLQGPPPGCVGSSADPRTVCCPSFATESQSYFRDPELGPDELPPDFSAVDFDDANACLDFSADQGWGRCAESSACACEHCAAELAACAADHACLFIRGCALGTGSCDPNMDPFFTGYGAGDQLNQALTMCMEGAACSASCAQP